MTSYSSYASVIPRFKYPEPVVAALRYFMGEPDDTRVARAEERARQYEAQAERDYLTVRDWIPERCVDFLDIGCGLGGLAIKLGCHYRQVVVNVLDGTDVRDDKKTGYSEGFQPYADRRLAVALIDANVPYGCAIKDYDPDPSLTIPADLIVSTKSWGHHYPIETYLDLALRSLSPDGRLIVDLRRGKGGLDTLVAAGFEHLAKVFETPKCERMVFRRAVV